MREIDLFCKVNSICHIKNTLEGIEFKLNVERADKTTGYVIFKGVINWDVTGHDISVREIRSEEGILIKQSLFDQDANKVAIYEPKIDRSLTISYYDNAKA